MRSWNEYSDARSRLDRGGFTLIEILVVVAIIGLMASAAMVAIGGARGFFKSATAKMRLDDLSQALELYKQKFGEYPPDSCATDSEIQRHILKRWPKALKAREVGMDKMIGFARAEMSRTPGSAALFWLAGPMDDTPDGPVYDGFLTDVTNPFGLDAGGNRRPYDGDLANEPTEAPLLELTYDSEGTNNGNYNRDGFVFNGQVVAYFRSYGKTQYAGKEFHWHDAGVVAPYMKNGKWYNPKTFQLILPGADECYGIDPHGNEDHEADGSHDYVPRDVAVVPPTKLDEQRQPVDSSETNPLSTADLDNITNFSNGATLDSELE